MLTSTHLYLAHSPSQGHTETNKTCSHSLRVDLESPGKHANTERLQPGFESGVLTTRPLCRLQAKPLFLKHRVSVQSQRAIYVTWKHFVLQQETQRGNTEQRKLRGR